MEVNQKIVEKINDIMKDAKEKMDRLQTIIVQCDYMDYLGVVLNVYEMTFREYCLFDLLVKQRPVTLDTVSRITTLFHTITNKYNSFISYHDNLLNYYRYNTATVAVRTIPTITIQHQNQSSHL